MIRHIVFWKLKKEAEGASAKENGQKMVDAFHALAGKIPGLLSIESGLNFNKAELGNGDVEYDIALDTTFHTKAALDIYQNHPLDVIYRSGLFGDLLEGVKAHRVEQLPFLSSHP